MFKLKITISIVILFVLFSKTTISQTVVDPGLPGTYSVSVANYNLGDAAFTHSTFPNPMEVRGSVHYPTTLSAGPFPVLMFLHGRHSTCYQTSNPSNTALSWPCASGYQSITSFEGYDYLAQQMASHGYIVISISANAINAADNSLSNRGMPARAALMQHHLNLWNTWNTTGGAPFGTLFVGKLNLNNVGTMGHSRGGEGVVAHALLNRSLGSPYGIKAVLPLAPVDFLREVLNGIPLMNIAPYCDGDVSDLQGVHFYDDTRYSLLTDQAPKHTVLVMGANHNFFNTVWTPGSYIAGTSDDWDDSYGTTDIHCGTSGSASKRLTPARQKAVMNAYASAFFRYYIGNELAFAPILELDNRKPPVSSTVDSSDIFVSYHPPASKRLDINRHLNEASETINNFSGTVTAVSLLKYDICGDDLTEVNCGVSSSHDQEPHSGTSSALGMSQLGIRWNAPGDYYENTIPVAYQNFTNYLNLQFRTAIDFSETTAGTKINFTVQLIDGLGATSSKEISDYTKSMSYPPGTEFLTLPKVCFNSIKIPLSDFTGVNLYQIQKVKFLFNKTTLGSIYVTDVMLSGLQPLATSIANNQALSSTIIYPNPATNSINVSLGENSKNVTSIKLYDLQGKLMIENNKITKDVETINLSDLSNGVYILCIKTNNEEKNYKIVKQ